MLQYKTGRTALPQYVLLGFYSLCPRTPLSTARQKQIKKKESRFRAEIGVKQVTRSREIETRFRNSCVLGIYGRRVRIGRDMKKKYVMLEISTECNFVPLQHRF